MLTVLSKKVSERNFKEVIIPEVVLASSSINTKGFQHVHIIHEDKAKERRSKVYPFIKQLDEYDILHTITENGEALFLSIPWSDNLTLEWREKE